MSDTVLSLVQQACGELGLAVPTAVFSSTAQDTIQERYLINAAGKELQRQYDWQAIDVEYQFNTPFYQYTGNTTLGSTTLSGMSSIASLTNNFMVTGTNIDQNTFVVSAAGTDVVISVPATGTATGGALTFSQTRYVMPADYDRLVDKTDWDKSQHWEMLGPETAQQWQWLKSGFIATGPRARYRRLGGFFQIWPPLGANRLLGFEYISKNWVFSAADVVAGSPPSKPAFSVDTDTCIYPDRLMVLGLKLKYFEAKGFDTTALFRDYTTQKTIAWANDKGSATLSMAPRLSQVLLTQQNIPDSFPG